MTGVEEALRCVDGRRTAWVEPGEAMVLDKNLFVERVVPGSILRELTDDEVEEYRALRGQPIGIKG